MNALDAAHHLNTSADLRFLETHAGLGAQIIPLYAAIGAGVAMCAYVCALKLTSYPDIVYAYTRVHLAIAPTSL